MDSSANLSFSIDKDSFRVETCFGFSFLLIDRHSICVFTLQNKNLTFLKFEI